MTTDQRDVSGVWYGRYRSHVDLQDNSFIAVLEEFGGMFDGSISEPNEGRGSGIRRATVDGQRDGGAIGFVKQYDGNGGFTHAVFYSGEVDAEGTVINGAWRIEWEHGSFTIQREKFDEAELEDGEEVILEVPVMR